MTPAVMIAIGLPVAGLCAAWGALLWRVGRLERDLAKFEALAGNVANVDAKIEHVRTDQGRRLGTVEKKLDTLEGFQSGYAAQRRRTKGLGVPNGGREGE